jgi:pimeloyl-ACP methyl ester carboxylesterase
LTGSSIHITRWGETGPRVVLVHGGIQGSPGGTRSFSAQERLAARGWQLVVPDRPGHGESLDPGRPDDAEADGAWVAELLEGGAHLVGHSFGGCVALAAAARRPAAVRSLTLIEPAMAALATHDPRVRRWLLRVVLANVFSLSPVTRAKRFTKLVGIPREMIDSLDPAALRRMGEGLRRGKIPGKEPLARELALVKREKIPLLVVDGGWSPSFAGVTETVAAHGGGRRIVVPSLHHFPQLVSDEFNQALDAFMRKEGRA